MMKRRNIALGLIACSLSAIVQGQSVWDKMKKTAQDAQKNSHTTQTAPARPVANAASAAASGQAAGTQGSPEPTAQIAARGISGGHRHQARYGSTGRNDDSESAQRPIENYSTYICSSVDSEPDAYFRRACGDSRGPRGDA
jgi:hypothetical protein